MRSIFRFVISLICILILIFIFISFLFYSSNKELKQEITLYEQQKIIDKTINLYDYTLDNPNIINNPYKISPLTSLVIFNTNNYCSPKVTIYGKNGNDLVYKYEKSKKHYLIIYGLYSNYNNEVNIKCGNEEKDINIKTDKLPDDIDYKEIDYINELNFVNSNYLYAIDKDNEVRWILTNKYNSNINILNNNNLIISSNELYTDKSSTSIIEINLLGKIYNNYYIKNKGNITVDKNYIYVDNKNKIDRQTGKISKSKKNNGKINNKLNNLNYSLKLKDMVIFNNYENTKFIDKNISLFNPKKIDKEYKKLNIKFNKINNRLLIEGNFKGKEVYLILENTFDKNVVKLNKNINYIYSNELKDKYNIYLKIDNKLYKTNYYINFNN